MRRRVGLIRRSHQTMMQISKSLSNRELRSEDSQLEDSSAGQEGKAFRSLLCSPPLAGGCLEKSMTLVPMLIQTLKGLIAFFSYTLYRRAASHFLK